MGARGSGALLPVFGKLENVHLPLSAHFGMMDFLGRIFMLPVLGHWPLAYNQ